MASGEQPYWLPSERFIAVLRLACRYETENRKIHITFDDGNKSDISIALPILNDFGRRASFFILSDMIGKADFVDAADITQLRKNGMTIGSHGAAHVEWTTLDDAELAAQVKRSMRTLSSIAGTSVTTVAVPFGAYDSRVLRVLRPLGITTVYTSEGGPTSSNAWLKARNTIHIDTPIDLIEKLICGRASLAQHLRFFARMLTQRIR